MKLNHPLSIVRVSLGALALAALGTLSAEAAVASARPTVLDVRPITPQDIKDHKLTGIQGASGLTTAGIGQPFHFEVRVDGHLAVDYGLPTVNFELVEKPIGSAATLAPSPLGTNVPLFEVVERELDALAGRSFLRPDVAGSYVVRATVTGDTHMTSTNGVKVLTTTVTAATYLGINGCTLCHSGSHRTGDMVTPWAQTGHATFLTRAIDGLASDHYGKNCISCHTVGFDANTNSVNGGFDDIAAKVGWTFPTNAHLEVGNWEAMPAALKNVSNIQCENCHGPGSEHAFAAITTVGNPGKIGMSLNSGNCGQCHDSVPTHKNNLEWNNSLHAVATTAPTGAGRESCARCHSGVGHVEWAKTGKTSVDPTYEPIGCAACHDPHDVTNPHQLRKAAPVTLMDGTVVANAGTGTSCLSCHISRRKAVDYVETTSGGSTFGPHHSLQGDMVAGANAINYGKNIPSSAHRSVVKDNCATCHMQTVLRTEPGFGKVGGHTFKVGYDGGTPDDQADDVHLTAACAECHGPMDTFNIARDDYDGNGVIQGVQDEVKGLLSQLAYLLPPVGPKETITINNKWTKQQLKAGYNYSFVDQDGSYGIHNAAYAVGLIKASIADIKDDGDNDGVSDKWEIAMFGSITHCDGTTDSDNDGVNNALEWAAGTNPLLADSDNDGIADLIELQAGSDPLSAQDKPGYIVKLHNAGELEFLAETGKTYQIEKCAEVGGGWVAWGEPIVGNGQMVSRLTTMRGDQKGYFRIKTM